MNSLLTAFKLSFKLVNPCISISLYSRCNQTTISTPFIK